MSTDVKIKVSEILGLVRDKIFESDNQDTLFNGKYFEQMCCALEVVSDTEMAISAYSSNEFGEDIPLKYLAVYGLLQAIFVQQHAVEHLCQSLGLTVTILADYPRLKEIRKIRYDIVGHPTQRGLGSVPKSYHSISQITLNHNGFTSRTSFEGNIPSELKEIDLIALMSDQEECVSSILASLLEKLKIDD